MKLKEHNILLLDDEILALSYLKDTIEDITKKLRYFNSYNILSTTNQNEFWTLLETNLPKIIFLDIQMPRKNGLEIAEEIRKKSSQLGYINENLPIIVFTTAYENFGHKAFQVNAIDYIMKPIDEEKIENTLKKIETIHTGLLKDSEEKIKIHSSGIDLEIPLKDILYFKADMKYIVVVTAKKEFLASDTLLSLEEKYTDFIKVHRAYLVNPTYINKFYKKDNHWWLSLKEHKEQIPVSRRQKQEIEKKIDYTQIFFD